MKLMACFLVTRVLEGKALDGLMMEAKKLLKKNKSKQKVLTDPKQALTTTEPYTETEIKEKPSYVVDNCLVSVRYWSSVFDGPAVSIIVVGQPEKAAKVKSWLEPVCRFWFSNGQIHDDREEFTVSENVYDCPDDLDWLGKYFYAEVLAKDLQDGSVKLKPYVGPTLWDEVKGLVISGERLSGDPEILHEIEDQARLEGSLVNRSQIQKVLESVPLVFSENWVSPEEYKGLTTAQKIIYAQVVNDGFLLIGPEIQRIIELALQYKKEFKQTVNQ